jgi:hypothetical protein
MYSLIVIASSVPKKKSLIRRRGKVICVQIQKILVNFFDKFDDFYDNPLKMSKGFGITKTFFYVRPAWAIIWW